MFFDAILCSLLELFEVPACFGNANDGAGELPSFCQLLQGRKDLFVSKVACSAKKNHSVGIRLIHLTTVTPTPDRTHPLGKVSRRVGGHVATQAKLRLEWADPMLWLPV